MLSFFLYLIILISGGLGLFALPFVAILLLGLWWRQWRGERDSDDRDQLRGLVAVLAFQELLIYGILGVLGVFTDSDPDPNRSARTRLVALVLGTAAAIYLWQGGRLPDRYLPLRNGWLRALAAAGSVGAMLYAAHAFEVLPALLKSLNSRPAGPPSVTQVFGTAMCGLIGLVAVLYAGQLWWRLVEVGLPPKPPSTLADP